MDEAKNSQTAGSGKKTGMAALAYILFFIPMLTESKNDPFVKYHIKQGIVLFVYWVIAWAIETVIPIIGAILYPILNVAGIILLIIGVVRASQGKEMPLPFIGKYADKFNF